MDHFSKKFTKKKIINLLLKEPLIRSKSVNQID